MAKGIEKFSAAAALAKAEYQERLLRSLGGTLVRITWLMACVALLFAPAAFGQGAASCIVKQIEIEIGVGTLRGLAGGIDSLGMQVHFTDGTAETWQNINESATWPANGTHTAVVQLSSAKPLNKIKSTLVFDKAPVGSRPWNMSFLKVTAIGSGISAPIGAYGSYNFLVTSNVISVSPPPGAACSPSLNPVAGPARAIAPTPVESRGQVTNEKVVGVVAQGEKNPTPRGALLTPGSQQTLLGPQANSSSSGGGPLALNSGANQDVSSSDGRTLKLNGGTNQGVSSNNGGPLELNGRTNQSVSPNGRSTVTLNGGTTQGAGGTLAVSGGTQTNSPSSGGAIENTTPAGNPVVTRPPAIQEDPNVYVAQACAKDPTMRILGFDDGGTVYWAQRSYLVLASAEATRFSTPRHRFKLFGCSFGNWNSAGSRVHGIGDTGGGDTIIFDFETGLWSANSIAITVPPGVGSGKRFASTICVQRADGQRACALL